MLLSNLNSDISRLCYISCLKMGFQLTVLE